MRYNNKSPETFINSFEMKSNHFLFLFILILNCKNIKIADNEKYSINNTGYELVKDWPKLPKGYLMSQVTGVGVDTSQNIFLFQRTGRSWTMPFPDSLISNNTVLMLERETGKIINSWGANLFIMPHGLTVDKENNVWLTDVLLHQVFKFNHKGKLLLKLGVARTPGNDSTHFNLPTDVAVAKDGSFYVSDGYGNSRIVKFSKEGNYMFEWGKKGDKISEFTTPHGIDLDAHGNVYVADRDNNRIQKFDANGKFLKMWKNDAALQLYALSIDKTAQNLLAVDYFIEKDNLIKGSDIIEFDSSSNFINRFGRTKSYNGPICRYHDITIDNESNIYVADILGNRIQKFKKVITN